MSRSIKSDNRLTDSVTRIRSKARSVTPRSSTIVTALKVGFRKASYPIPTTDSRCKGVTAYSLHPGVVYTNLQGADPSCFGSFMQLTMKITPTVTPQEGALNSLYAATSPDAPAKGQGRFFVPVGKLQKSVDKWIDDREGNAKLWEHSERAIHHIN